MHADQAKFWPAGSTMVKNLCAGVGAGGVETKAVAPTQTPVRPNTELLEMEKDVVDLDEVIVELEGAEGIEEERRSGQAEPEIEELEERVGNAELGLGKCGDCTQFVPNTEQPTSDELERHEAPGHANFKMLVPSMPQGNATAICSPQQRWQTETNKFW